MCAFAPDHRIRLTHAIRSHYDAPRRLRMLARLGMNFAASSRLVEERVLTRWSNDFPIPGDISFSLGRASRSRVATSFVRAGRTNRFPRRGFRVVSAKLIITSRRNFVNFVVLVSVIVGGRSFCADVPHNDQRESPGRVCAHTYFRIERARVRECKRAISRGPT